MRRKSSLLVNPSTEMWGCRLFINPVFAALRPSDLPLGNLWYALHIEASHSSLPVLTVYAMRRLLQLRQIWLVPVWMPFPSYRFLPFPIFISKCGLMRLPWSQYWSLASFRARSLNGKILVCRAQMPISSTFLFAIRQLLVMGFELTSVLGMGRGFPGPVIPPISHISNAIYVLSFLCWTLCV